jgi:hypothetical protein
MKKIIVLLLVATMAAFTCNAQAFDGGEIEHANVVTTQAPGNGLIKAGTIVASTAGGAGLVLLIVGLCTDLPAIAIVGGVYLAGGIGVGLPLILVGAAKNRAALAVNTQPIFNYDFALNDHLTLSTNLNIMSHKNLGLSPAPTHKNHYAGAGLVLHF